MNLLCVERENITNTERGMGTYITNDKEKVAALKKKWLRVLSNPLSGEWKVSALAVLRLSELYMNT